MLRFGFAKPQYVLLLTMRSKCAEKKNCPQAGFEPSTSSTSSTSACEPCALPSELREGVDRATHACMASVD